MVFFLIIVSSIELLIKVRIIQFKVVKDAVSWSSCVYFKNFLCCLTAVSSKEVKDLRCPILCALFLCQLGKFIFNFTWFSRWWFFFLLLRSLSVFGACQAMNHAQAVITLTVVERSKVVTSATNFSCSSSLLQLHLAV